MAARRGQIRGIVQGVGFRPFVAGLARGLGLRGHVENRGGEVIVAIEGCETALDAFAARLPEEAPEAAQIEAARWMEVEGGLGDGFVIRASEARGEGVLAIGPDLRVCAACLAEAEDPEDRRFGYGLNACTACGPRLTITARSPWARADSAMASFPACPACRQEFEDPEDRRWHAEAIACPDCGPRLRLEGLDGRGLAGPEGSIEAAAELLRRGQVLGLKGVGGFQLIVDARSEAAVEALRARKRRPHKALAVMVADLRSAAELVELTGPAAAALDSPAGPIVLLPRQGPKVAAGVAEGVAPGQPRLGLMLPTSAAHARLLAAFGGPIVATSGNVHGRPMARTLDEARAQLTGVADALLVHDRAILRRCDDSVVQVVEGRPRVLRLGRGLAPARFELPGSVDASLLALGGHLQHTPAYAGEGLALVWPYVGDLDEAETRVAMAEGLADLCGTIGRAPTRVVCDAHPDYATTRWAEAAQRRDPSLRVDRVWHHHAHVAAVLAEHGRSAALGVSWDGAGLGTDHSSWGGEFLLVEGARFRRLAHLRPFPLPGADAAARDGLRVLAGMLAAAELPAPRLGGEQDEALARFLSIARRPRLSPSSSAVGRLFDAFAALVGLRRRSRYQAEAACALEHAAAAHGPAPAYPFGFDGARLDWRPALVGAIEERERPGLVAARVHATLIAMILAVVERHRPRTVALSGGCFANTLLLAGASEALRGAGVEVLSPERLPPGDGGLALGQAWVATRSEEVSACA